MSVALTFGSVGDIIAICQLVIELGHALNDATGSAKQYQDLRKDLDEFVRLLVQVIGIFEQYESSPWMNGLDSEIRRVVAECGNLIQDALDHFRPKYHNSLKLGGSGKVFKDTMKKVEWSLREKESLRVIQEKTGVYTARITLLMGIATRKSAHVDNATMLVRIEEINKLVSSEADRLLQMHQEQATSIRDQEKQFCELKKSMKAQEQSSNSIWSTLSSMSFAIVELKDMVGNVAQMTLSLRDILSSPIIMYNLDPTHGKPVLLEDALGNVLEIPVDWIHDWSMFDTLLTHRFQNMRGHQKVVRREFALEEHCSGKDISRQLPWSASIRRGMKINMSMVFANATILHGCCPRCKTAADAPEDISVCCTNKECGMWFRMLNKAEQQRPCEAAQETDEDDSEEISHIEVQAIIDEPSDFHRVRIILPDEETAATLRVFELWLKDLKEGRPHDGYDRPPPDRYGR